MRRASPKRSFLLRSAGSEKLFVLSYFSQSTSPEPLVARLLALLGYLPAGLKML